MDFQSSIGTLLKKQGINPALLEVPPDSKLGDYALPCFTLGNPAEKAKELAGKLSAPFLKEVVAKGPYVNFFLKPERLAKAVLEDVFKKNYGCQGKKKDKIMVEYSQPNTHKAFHVGHLRGTSIGEALSRILKYAGYSVIQVNYSGDTGAHIAKWLWYYRKHKSEPGKDLEKWISEIYVKAIQELEKNPEAQREVDEILSDLDKQKPGELLEIYKKTKKQSIEAFKKIYKELHAHFDYWFFESEVEKRGKEISKELVEKKIAKVDDGATIIDLDKLGIWVLLRKDGTPLYSAKDLALAQAKFEKYHIDRSIYVVGAAQSTYLKQLFATLKLMGFPQVEKCHHLSFSEVRLPTGKMSSRTGQNILYSDIREEIQRYATEEVKKRHEDWSAKRVNDIVEQVTIAALKYDMLAIHPNKNIIFDPKKATEFEGETGPYLQYTYARACSILKKAAKSKKGDGKTLLHEKEQALLRILKEFPTAIDRVAREYAPHHLVNYCMALAKAFNSFYHDCRVVEDGKTNNDRFALVKASTVVLGSGLELLAIDAPEQM